MAVFSTRNRWSVGVLEYWSVGILENYIMRIVLLTLLCVLTGLPGMADDPAAKAYLEGRLDDAAKILSTEIKQGNARSSRRLLLGRIYFMQEKWEDAYSIINSLLLKDSENSQGLELMGRIHFRQKSFEKALPFYKIAIRESNSTELKLEYAEALIETDQKIKAVAELKKIVKGQKTFPHAYYLLGKLRLERGLAHWASSQLWSARKLGCRKKDLSLLLAKSFFLEGRLTGPLRKTGPLNKAVIADRNENYIIVRQAGPDKPGIWFTAEPDTALYQAETAIAESGGNACDELYVIAAECWLRSGAYKRAQSYISRIRHDNQSKRRLIMKTALKKRELDKFNSTVRSLPETSDDTDNSIVGLLMEAALIAQVDGKFSTAYRFLEQADKRQGGRADVLRLMVNVLNLQGKTEAAENKLRLLKDLHPDSPAVKME
jgi:tetratricopeptide (TPR) repeat protein